MRSRVKAGGVLATRCEGEICDMMLLVEDAFSTMDQEERAALETELDQAARDFENGDFVDAKEFLSQLRTKKA